MPTAHRPIRPHAQARPSPGAAHTRGTREARAAHRARPRVPSHRAPSRDARDLPAQPCAERVRAARVGGCRVLCFGTLDTCHGGSPWRGCRGSCTTRTGFHPSRRLRGTARALRGVAGAVRRSPRCAPRRQPTARRKPWRPMALSGAYGAQRAHGASVRRYVPRLSQPYTVRRCVPSVRLLFCLDWHNWLTWHTSQHIASTLDNRNAQCAYASILLYLLLS